MTKKAFLTSVARFLGRGPRTGYVDHFDAARVAGWAFDPGAPDEPALLSLHVDGTPEMNIVADIPREDVRSAGLGPLRCGFDATLPRRLRDGRAHRVELRLGANGPVLRGGTLTLEADDSLRASPAEQPAPEPDRAAPADAPAAPAEGVAFYDSRHAAISGWATGCTSVTLHFNGQPPQEIRLDREVPGFGSGTRPGFRVPIPDALRDGARHEVRVTCGRTGLALDGTPVRFSLVPDRILVELEALEGQTATFRLRHATGTPDDVPVRVCADGVTLDARALAGTGGVLVDLPWDARCLVVSTPEGEVLARFGITDGQWAESPVHDLPAGALSPETCAAATAAFADFCDDPDDRFDPLWYRWAIPGARALDDDQLLPHYRDIGAGQGAGPGPFFDETAARALFPALAEAIADARLPCAFALELVLGRGRLDTLTGLDRPISRALSEGAGLPDMPVPRPEIPPTPAPVVARLPAPVAALDPSRSIYAAWAARLDIPDTTREELARDDQAMRQTVAASALTRAPLVSIIMPSWNRAFTIGEAIQSVLDQSYRNWELIVCDDASEDRTQDVVRGFDDPRIRYMKFLKSNGAGARNKGLRHARGEYIAYLDSDNIWHPLFLDTMLRRLMSSPGNAIAYSAYLDTVIEGARVRLDAIPRPNFRPIRLSSKNFIDLNSIVHHRRVHDWMGGFDNDLPRLQDWDLALRYTSIFRPVFVNHIGVFYRRNVAWGQVTHLFMGSHAQGTVAEKTRRRLEEAHERLHVSWPGRSRITVLVGARRPGHRPDPGHCLVADSLARLAVRVADVDLVELGAAPAAAQDGDPPGLTRHAIPLELQRDPARLGVALGALVRGRPVLSVGCAAGYLRAVQGLDPVLTWRLRNSGEGSCLQGLDLPFARFELGALPLDLPEGRHAASDLTVLVLPPQQGTPDTRAALHRQLAAEAQRRGLTLLLPPGDGQGWTRIDKSGAQPQQPDPQTRLPALLGQVGMTACMTPVSELEPFDLALLNALQGRSVPAAVLPDEGRARATGFARQWIEARAAYEIQVNDPKWIFDKIRKLMGDDAGLQRLQERSLTVHRIAHHPDLARERLIHALYRLLHDFPHREVIDGQF